MKRPRFSLRWMLIVFAGFSVLLYLFFVRPAVLANKLVADAKAGDFSSLRNVNVYQSSIGESLEYLTSKRNGLIRTRIEPTTRADLLHLRRRVVLECDYDTYEEDLKHKDPAAEKVYSTRGYEIVTGAIGLTAVRSYHAVNNVYPPSYKYPYVLK